MGRWTRAGATGALLAVGLGTSACTKSRDSARAPDAVLQDDLRQAAAAVAGRGAAPPAPTAAAPTLVQTAAQPGTGTGATRYPAPTSKAQAASWPKVGKWWHTQQPGEPQSPRLTAMITEPADRVRSLDEAFALFQRETGIAVTSAPRFETFEAWRQFDGTDMRAALAETRLGGAPGVAYVVLTRQKKDRGQFRVWAAEVPRETFAAWGGIARMMVLYGDLPSVRVIPAERRGQIANAPFHQQVAFHEATVNRVYSQGVAQLMASQLALTQQMTQMNYNLLFGKPITAPAWKQ